MRAKNAPTNMLAQTAQRIRRCSPWQSCRQSPTRHVGLWTEQIVCARQRDELRLETVVAQEDAAGALCAGDRLDHVQPLGEHQLGDGQACTPVYARLAMNEAAAALVAGCANECGCLGQMLAHDGVTLFVVSVDLEVMACGSVGRPTVRAGNVEYVRDSECVHRRQVAGTTLVTQEQVWQNFNGRLDAAPVRLVKDIAHSHEPG